MSADVTSAVDERQGGDAEEHDEHGDRLAEAVCGTTSPYPTVVTVWAAHQSRLPKLVEDSGVEPASERLPPRPA